MEITIKNVAMTYPSGKQALRGLDLELRSPSLVGLLGPNGAGKSTLMKLLVSALLPTSGTIRVDGRPLTECERQLKSRLGCPRISGSLTSSPWRSFSTTCPH